MASTAGLVEPFKTHVEQLLAKSGGRVTLSSGFRTYSEQLALRKKNGCPDPLHSPASECRIETAIPGTSMHEVGKAVDFGGDLTLAASLGPIYGMRRTIASEPWHFEPTDAAVLPDAPAQDGPGITGAIAGAGNDEGFVDKVLTGLARILVTGLVIGGGIALLGAGAYRATTGRKLTKTIADDAAKGAKVAGTAAIAGA